MGVHDMSKFDFNDEGFPRLSAKQLDAQQPYRPKGGEPGYDGRKPEKGTRRENMYSADGQREAVETDENLNHSPVKWLYSRRQLVDRQYYAALRLEKDWQLSMIEPVASTVLVGAGGTNETPLEAMLRAKDSWFDARKALGPFAWPIIELVVWQGNTVEESAKAMHIHPKVTMGYLQLALHLLADFYGYPGEIPAALKAALLAERESVRAVVNKLSGRSQPVRAAPDKGKSKSQKPWVQMICAGCRCPLPKDPRSSLVGEWNGAPLKLCTKCAEEEPDEIAKCGAAKTHASYRARLWLPPVHEPDAATAGKRRQKKAA